MEPSLAPREKTKKVLLLTEDSKLISFCTYAGKDDIQPTELSPWVGFVYTFPEYRGHRYVGLLMAKYGNVIRKGNLRIGNH